MNTPDPKLPPLDPRYPTRPLIVTVHVPENWEQRLDMQWVLEREIQADRWSWNWPSSAPASPEPASRVEVSDITALTCPHCHQLAPGWTADHLSDGYRWRCGKEYHCREAAVDD